jgi:hypothetical protein
MSCVIEFEQDWGIEEYGVGDPGFTGTGQYYGVRHKHEDGWKMAITTCDDGKKRCSCGAVAPDSMVGMLDMMRWRR